MGAGVSTEGAPLTKVKCKNNLGVLFLGEAEKAFYDGHRSGRRGDRALVRGRRVREDAPPGATSAMPCFRTSNSGSLGNKSRKLRRIKSRAQSRKFRSARAVGDECQQARPDRVAPLYEIAELAREVYAKAMNDVCEGGPPLNPHRPRARAEVKAQNEYADKTAPCLVALRVRGSVYCWSRSGKIEADPRRPTANRFNPAV